MPSRYVLTLILIGIAAILMGAWLIAIAVTL